MSCCISSRTLILELSRISDQWGRDMANKKFVVKLNGEEREQLREVISKGKAKAKTIVQGAHSAESRSG
jgi:hypothetical protein